MPQPLVHIDYIARQKQRDVLLIEFHNTETGVKLDYTLNPARKKIIEWFTASDIPPYECGGYASETRLDSYRGQIYIDVPYDKTDPVFRKVETYLENPGGSMEFDGAWFCYFPLDVCMRNAHHDLPGFWEYLLEKL